MYGIADFDSAKYDNALSFIGFSSRKPRSL